jgi:hypothetical protein
MDGYTDIMLGGLGYDPGWSGASGGWVGSVFDLGEFIGGTLQFRLVFGSDSGVTGPGFWVDDIAFDTSGIPTAVGEEPAAAIARPVLTAFPSPFNPATTIAWRRAADGPMRITLYDASGRRLRQLWDGQAPAAGTLRFDGRDGEGRELPSGLYLLRLRDGSGQASRRLLLAR